MFKSDWIPVLPNRLIQLHLSSSKNCMISNFLVASENLVSFSFGFRRNLTNREQQGSRLFFLWLRGIALGREVLYNLNNLQMA